MSIGHLIHKIGLFQNSTLKIQGQGHEWGESWKSQHGSNILSTHIPFIPCQSAIPFPRYDFFKIWPFLKIQGQSHGWDQSWKSQSGCYILSTHIPFVPCQSALPFPRYSIFKLWPWKSKVKVMGEGNVESHNMGATFYRLTSLSFYVNWTSHSWDTAFSKFDPENPRSRSWVRWTLKVTTWVQHSIDLHPFNSMSIRHPIPEIRLFQNLTLKIQGQGHWWGDVEIKSQSGCNILSTHIPFVPCQSGIPFLSYDFFKIWPWKSRVKVMGHEVTVQSHNVGLASYRLTSLSFHVKWASHSWVMTFQNLTLKIKGQGHEWGHSSKSQCGTNILSIHIPFGPCQSALPFLRYSIFKIWPWKSKVKVKWPWCCTTTGLDNSIELWMV